MPRFFELGGRGIHVPLEQIIAHFLPTLFPGVEILERAVFRVTRDADFEVSDDADDLLEAVESQLRRRRFGDVVRVEVSSSASSEMVARLQSGLEADETQIYRVDGLLDLSELKELVAVDRPDLKYEPWIPAIPARLASAQSDLPKIFDEIRRGDVLVHQPYGSFRASFEVFAQAAVRDPNVNAMKTAVYRTSDDSELVAALIQCAEQGKQSVCLVELKARFDELRNIEWSRALEQAGVHVAYGFPDLKIHAKMTLIVRREGDLLRRYAHIGTGNYHAATARLYEDLGIFTADEDITADVADLFNYITGFGRPQKFRKLLVAPFTLRSGLVDEIRAVAAAASDGKHAHIRLKLNHLVDPKIVAELYEASRAGARIDIIARSTCALRPGVDGLSENIHVRSIVGRFLEHSRVYSFEADERVATYIGSAGPDAAQPRSPHRGARAGRERPRAGGDPRDPRQRARRRHERVDPLRVGRVGEGDAGEGREATLASRDDDAAVIEASTPRRPRPARRLARATECTSEETREQGAARGSVRLRPQRGAEPDGCRSPPPSFGRSHPCALRRVGSGE